jgi:hypothetical protein
MIFDKMRVKILLLPIGGLMSLETQPMKILVISPSGRGRDNLVVLLESLSFPINLMVVDTCNDAEKAMDSEKRVTIMIDYRFPDEILEEDISRLILHDSVHHIVLLQARNAPKCHFTHYSTSEVVYNDLSVDVLNNLLKNIDQNQ